MFGADTAVGVSSRQGLLLQVDPARIDDLDENTAALLTVDSGAVSVGDPAALMNRLVSGAGLCPETRVVAQSDERRAFDQGIVDRRALPRPLTSSPASGCPGSAEVAARPGWRRHERRSWPAGGGVPATLPGMFMLHGRLAARPGKRDELLAILTEDAGAESLPGCRLYVVALDEDDADGVWATEIWVSQDAHDASLQIGSVRERIARAMPLIDVSGIRQQRLEPLVGIPD